MMMAMTTMSNNTVKMMGLEGTRRNARRSNISNLMAKLGAFLRSRLQSGSETRCSAIRNDCEEMMRRISLMSWTAENNLVSRNIV